MSTLAIMGLPQGVEWILLLLLGLLLFGRRLPEVGKSLGRSIVEFKKGIKGIEDEIETTSSGAVAKGGGGSSPARLEEPIRREPEKAAEERRVSREDVVE